MKRFGKILAVAALAMVSYGAHAELAPQWSKGTVLLNLEAGVQPFGGGISVDYVLFDNWWKGHFTVGGEFDFSKPAKHWRAAGGTPRATYGLNISPEFEVHASVGVGYGAEKYSYDNVTDKKSFIFYNEFVGCRYFFAEGVSVIFEAGYSNWFPEVRGGLSLKF
ncbi:MAG: hypothetical protein J6X21_03670 [Bacteroidaceae bacterium]|nr:hypothetical protein [Bacteroidaceae bacterium]